jgi:hypothetical protein
VAPFIGKIVDDNDVPIERYRCPAAHCIHLPTSNLVESTLATVHPWTEVTKGPGLWTAGIAILYRSIGAAQTRGRAKGKLLERPVGSSPTAPIESTRNGGRPIQPQPQALTRYPALPRQSPLAAPTHLQLATAAVPTAAGRMAKAPAAI